LASGILYGDQWAPLQVIFAPWLKPLVAPLTTRAGYIHWTSCCSNS